MRSITTAVAAAAWLGAALLLSASVAPAAFAVLPNRTTAGALVGRVLPVVFVSGILLGLLALALLLSLQRSAVLLAGAAAALVWVVACTLAQFVVTPRIERIRSAVGGPIDALTVTDPQRIAFGQLHGVSVGLLGIGLLAAAVVLIVAVRIDVGR